mgnify:CR=1 FL=1
MSLIIIIVDSVYVLNEKECKEAYPFHLFLSGHQPAILRVSMTKKITLHQ